MELPTGTVTFLFTDIEGSTKVAQEHPEAWESLQERHHAILRSVMENHDGYVFQIIGDAFCVAFNNPGDGIAAATDAQRYLQLEDWGETKIKVRMGLHTGQAERRENGYHGYLTLALVQRVMSAAYGGQILLSNACAALIHDKLTDGISLRDMKENRLKGILNPERLWQVVVPDLQQDFPLLSSLNTIANNLPAQITSFIGREKEVEQIKQVIKQNRLVTLTGSGGTGKSRLSLRVAEEIMEIFIDGVWFVELGPLSNPALVTGTVANVFGVREEVGHAFIHTLIDWFKDRELLLILDNCEHLIEACAQFAEVVIHNTPKIRILASSREVLGISGELSWRVPSLSTPDLHLRIHDIKRLEEYAAVQLFIERARLANRDFAVNAANIQTAAQICTRLDGIPLAIELAAARINVLSVNQIFARLDDRFHLLTGGSRTALPHQQTLRTLIDWSYDLLSESERILLCRLSIFAGGWILEAAEKVCGNLGRDLPVDVLDGLSHLVSKSLVIAEEQNGEARYRMLETIQQYALDKLVEDGGLEQAKSRHLGFFSQLAQKVGPGLRGPHQAALLNGLEIEIDNLRAALEWSLDHNIMAEIELAAAMLWFWLWGEHYREGWEWITTGLSRAESSEHPPIRAKALNAATEMAFIMGDIVAARIYVNEALKISDELGDDAGCAESTKLLGLIAWQQSDYAVGRQHLQEGVMLFKQLGDKLGIADCLHFLGHQALDQSDYTSARSYFEESMKLFSQIGDTLSLIPLVKDLGLVAYLQGDSVSARPYCEKCLTLARHMANKDYIGESLSILGDLARYEGDYQLAEALYNENLALLRNAGIKRNIPSALHNLAYVALHQGADQKAARCFSESLSLFQEQGDRKGVAECLAGLAGVLTVRGKAKQAAALFGAAEAVREALGVVLWPANQIAHDQNVAAARTQMGEDTFDHAWVEGKAMSTEDAVKVALEETI
jgi:predicted ATPase/class 3 adenylate cyclase